MEHLCVDRVAQREEAIHTILFGGYVGSSVEKKLVAQQETERSGFLVARVKQDRHIAFILAKVLGASGRVFIGVNFKSRGFPLCHSVYTE